MDLATLWPSFATAVFVGGVAWGATRNALNGTRIRVQQIQDELRNHIKDESNADIDTHERITRVETKLDILLSGFRLTQGSDEFKPR